MNILVPDDGSDRSLAAMEYAVDRFPDAEITALHVVDETYLENPYGRLLVGHPVGAILDYAEEHGVDQIVLGGKGLSNVPELLLGSVSFGVVLHADVPVTVVR